MRVDGVSKFSKENRYGYFPSFSLAWRIIQESFIENLNVFDDLKLRAGWGQIGNHGIRYTLHFQIMQVIQMFYTEMQTMV